jgi:hypothetical protein
VLGHRGDVTLSRENTADRGAHAPDARELDRGEPDRGAEASIERAAAQPRLGRGARDVVAALGIDEPSHDVAHVGIRERSRLDARRQPFGPHALEGDVVRRARERARESEGANAEHLGGRPHEIADRDRIDAEHLGGGVGPEPDAAQYQPTSHRHAERAQARADQARGDGRTLVGHDEQRHTAVGPDGVQRRLAGGQGDVDGPASEDVLGEWLGRRFLALEESPGRVRERHVRWSAG